MNDTEIKNPFGGEEEEEAVDAVWIIMCAFITFTMHTGFALLESGLVSDRNKVNLMMKNMINVCIGGVVYWFFGYGISFGRNQNKGNSFSGEGNFITDVSVVSEGHVYTKFFFQSSFASASTAIISGAIAERIHLFSYIVIIIANTGLIYEFPAHWVWDSNGWLFKRGVHDFAGSAVIHMAGGAAAFTIAYILGPQQGKFIEPKQSFKISDPINVITGTFFLWWGWLGFNCGSTFAVSNGSWKLASKVAVVTMNGAIAGGASGLLLSFALRNKRNYMINVAELSHGILGGVVSITACCDVIRPWEGLLIGFIGGFIANGAVKSLELLKIDDPLGAFGVHYASGFWAMFATGLFADTESKMGGIFRIGNGNLLAYNIVTAALVSLWSGGLNAFVIWILKKTIGIRMSTEKEQLGCDAVELNIIEEKHDKTVQFFYKSVTMGNEHNPSPDSN